MAQKLALGQSTLRIRDSKLQLRLSASAYFTQPTSHGSTQASIKSIDLSNLKDVWITEAPELTLRVFVGGDWIENEMGTFASRLKNELCDMEIWSDLGFSVDAKAGEDEGDSDIFGIQCLKLGLHKDCRIGNNCKGWTLPKSMTNAIEVCPPPAISVITLASIDVQLKYILQVAQLENIPQIQGSFKLEIGVPGPETLFSEQPQVLDRMAKCKTSVRAHNTGSSEALRSHPIRISGYSTEKLHEERFRLFKTGIKRLIISNSIQDPTIRVSKQATTSCLADICPAVFNPGYRDAINQRGVTIPVATKAISSMLMRNENPSIKARLADLLNTTHSLHMNDSTVQPQAQQLRSAVQSSLWQVAQRNVSKPKPIKRRGSNISASCAQKVLAETDETVHLVLIDQQQSDGNIPGLLQSFEAQWGYENEESDEYLLNSEPESEGQLLDDLSEIGFTDIGDSTQTSLDEFCSTIQSSQTSCRNPDTMMLSSPGRMTDYDGDYIASYDICGDMDSHDTDIIMADGF